MRIIPSRTGDDISDIMIGMDRVGYLTEDAVYMFDRNGYAVHVAVYDTMAQARGIIDKWRASNQPSNTVAPISMIRGGSRRITERKWLSLKNILGR